jgi:polyhydroxybutyrate depolymerase
MIVRVVRIAGFAIFAFLTVAACSGSDATPGDGTATTPPAPPAAGTTPGADPGAPPAPVGTPPATTPPAGSAGCGAASTLKAGDQDLTVAGRTIHVHVPKSYDATKPAPLVLNFHGYLSNGVEQAGYSKMNDTSESGGFIVMYGEGTNHSWNGGTCCGDAVSQGIDDVKYIGQIIDTLEATSCVDAKRVFATGFSNGGFMVQRLACEMSDRIAAVAPVSGVLGIQTCTPARAVPLMHFHGTSDTVVRYGGTPEYGYPSVDDSIAGWVKRESCGTTPATSFQKGDVTCSTYSGCQAGSEITLCKVDGGGHTWPGGTVPFYLGKTTTDISASDAMWTFFQKHPLP